MPIDREEVEHVAYLARLGLSEEEKAKLQEQLNAILDYMRIIDQVDVSAIPPTASVLPLRNVMRADEVRPSLPVGDVLANAPAREDDFFRVPPVLEGE
ncbi:MAG TPA: Asp-tRNA(Asn)/Glu-tRNA(Gln) amidotransferase subunit GatC [Chloroflexota bacterium]